MARTAGPQFALPLLLLLLPREGPRAARGDDHTLCYNFTVIPKHRPGQPWCEVLGEVNGNKFLEYHCGSEVKPVGPLGMKVNATDTWKGQSEALRDLMEELKQKLLDVKPPISTTSASPATAPASTQSKAMTITPITWILSVTFSCSLLLGLLGCVL
ncbi:UL16-binding protein 6-like isoform X2 [Diceros bicornis minor]|uniref:UL16-binding protein 6-like isoform X2 n=1 Tax=Diceros bicornis minor TaxID=77932 RepID=UPI0026EDA414|nr:UL16-binding protein 6-like isoform X2 [Diceros bicornis minor]